MLFGHLAASDGVFSERRKFYWNDDVAWFQKASAFAFRTLNCVAGLTFDSLGPAGLELFKEICRIIK